MVADGKTEKLEKVTKYEMARMIGARALQISMGAPFLVKLEKEDLEKLHYNPVEIAKLEFEKGIMPIAIKRPSASSASSASKE